MEMILPIEITDLIIFYTNRFDLVFELASLYSLKNMYKGSQLWDNAAIIGNLKHILKLCGNEIEGCSLKSIDLAIKHKHVKISNFLNYMMYLKAIERNIP